MDINFFRQYCHNHLAILQPAFILQHAMKVSIIGESFWDSRAKKRLKLSADDYVSFDEYMMQVRTTHSLFDLIPYYFTIH